MKFRYFTHTLRDGKKGINKQKTGIKNQKTESKNKKTGEINCQRQKVQKLKIDHE